MLYRFGPFIADRGAFRAWRADGAPLELTPKLLDLLFYLLERPAVLVTKEELLEGVWPGANVTDNALAQAISELRDALGDEASAPTYIRTVARRGYRFVAPVESDRAGSATAANAPAPGSGATPQRTIAARASIAVLDFENLTGDADVAWLGTGIAETVTSDLSGLDQFTVIDRWRVVMAARTHASMHDIGRATGATMVVMGGFQRHGPRLRITARILDLASGDVVADAKVDGGIDEVFELQDGIVSAFARGLGLARMPASSRVGVRETSSLDAYRAFTEGMVKLESLDTTEIPGSIADFERAVAFDSGYAVAYTGLANAQFVTFEMSRATDALDVEALRSGIDYARRALQLDERLAEAHGTLSFLLVSAGAFDEARIAAQRAATLEPDSWRHQYRLGHASWGGARVRALDRALALHPQFAYASFESAMVHVARGHLDEAERIARAQMDAQDRQSAAAARFPGIGFHWLLGALEAMGGRHDAALAQFEDELTHLDPRRLYGPEYAASALVCRGHSLLECDRPHEALAAFRDAHSFVGRMVRAGIGEAIALDALGRTDESAALWHRLEQTERHQNDKGRRNEALITGALTAAGRGDIELAVRKLDTLLDALPPCFVGWNLSLEPALARHRDHAGLRAIFARIAERAR
jgi:DNA-binding winged helix-turn-helix (wHTH) protein/tetratricopeptide (TPR) repeat protein